MQVQIRILAVLHLLIGAVIFVDGLATLFLFYVASVTSGVSLGWVLPLGVLLAFLIAGTFIVSGIGLFRRRAWARPLGLGLSGFTFVAALPIPRSPAWVFPIGASVAAYGFWVLRSKRAVQPSQTGLPGYRVLDRVELASGERAGDVLVESLSPQTPAGRREAVLRRIAAAEGLDLVTLYSTVEAFEASLSDAAQTRHPEALRSGLLGRLERGTFHAC